MPVAAQIAADQHLNAFWEKETAQLRQKVTEASLIARTVLPSSYIEGQINQHRKNGYNHARWAVWT